MYAKSATSVSLDTLAKIFNSAFDGYIGSAVHLTAETLAENIKQNFVVLDRSYVFYPDNVSPNDSEPVAFGCIALRDDRPGEARLASMGVVPTSQEKGAGTKVLQVMIDKEREAGTKVLELECIQQNERGMRLYKRAGFVSIRELWGYEQNTTSNDPGKMHPDLVPCSMEEVEGVVQAHGADKLPWQAQGWITLPLAKQAFKMDQAYIVVSEVDDPEKDTIKLSCLIVKPEARGQGQAKKICKAVMEAYPGKKFQVRPFMPRDQGEHLAKSLGLERIELYLQQMRLQL